MENPSPRRRNLVYIHSFRALNTLSLAARVLSFRDSRSSYNRSPLGDQHIVKAWTFRPDENYVKGDLARAFTSVKHPSEPLLKSYGRSLE